MGMTEISVFFQKMLKTRRKKNTILYQGRYKVFFFFQSTVLYSGGYFGQFGGGAFGQPSIEETALL